MHKEGELSKTFWTFQVVLVLILIVIAMSIGYFREKHPIESIDIETINYKIIDIDYEYNDLIIEHKGEPYCIDADVNNNNVSVGNTVSCNVKTTFRKDLKPEVDINFKAFN